MVPSGADDGVGEQRPLLPLGAGERGACDNRDGMTVDKALGCCALAHGNGMAARGQGRGSSQCLDAGAKDDYESPPRCLGGRASRFGIAAINGLGAGLLPAGSMPRHSNVVKSSYSRPA